MIITKFIYYLRKKPNGNATPNINPRFTDPELSNPLAVTDVDKT